MTTSARHRKHRASILALVAATILAGVLAFPVRAWAGDVFLGAFMDRSTGASDYVYVSQDGKTFELLSIAYQDTDGTGKIDSGTSWSVYSLHDPAIGYKDGVFWMMSGWVKGNLFRPMFGSSRDLVNWSFPNTPSGVTGTVSEFPYIPASKVSEGRIASDTFDCAGPDFMFDDDGTTWIVVPLGYFGSRHGEATKDFMQPYICKVEGLERNPRNDSPGIYNRDAYPTTTSATAFTRIDLPFESSYTVDRMNLIDPSLYKENGRYYLSIKRDGVTNYVFSIDDLNKAGDRRAWRLENANVVTGYEGPCMTYGNGQYYYYTDKLSGYSDANGGGITGIYVQTSQNIGSGWTWPQRVLAIDSSKKVLPTRHGSVVRIDDPEAQELILSMRAQLGYTYDYDHQPFADVNVLTPHADDIVWLADEGISTGWNLTDGSKVFRGASTVKRQDMAAFLYRLAGSPDYAPTEEEMAKFADVTTQTPHAKEIWWLASTGISTGWQEEDGTFTFRGSQTVKRQDMAAFLHRLANYLGKGEGVAIGANPFSDVSASTPHYEDILWLASAGISTGWTSGGVTTYRGMNNVLRQDMAAFLRRLDALE